MSEETLYAAGWLVAGASRLPRAPRMSQNSEYVLDGETKLPRGLFGLSVPRPTTGVTTSSRAHGSNCDCYPCVDEIEKQELGTEIQEDEKDDEGRPELLEPRADDRVAELLVEVVELRAKEQRNQENLADILEKQRAERGLWQAQICELQAENHAHQEKFRQIAAANLEEAKRDRSRIKLELEADKAEKEKAQETIMRLRWRISRREKEKAIHETDYEAVSEEMRSLQKGIRRLYENSRSKDVWDGDSTPEGSGSSTDE